MHLYPVKAKVDGAVVRNLRLRANESGTVVWQMVRDSGEVHELLRTDGQPERVGATQNWRVGGVVVEPQRGCGCNHPMYTWVPPED
jgi:hypothetical protein